MKAENVKKMAVLGAGVMGHGIGQVAATAGYNVIIRDIDKEFLDKAEESIQNSLSRLVERGRLSPEDKDLILERISYTLDIGEAVSDAQLVVEAVPERMDIKNAVWKEVDSKAPKDAILASNTSSLSITKMAEAVSIPERFVGMHFFNPPIIMKLVEVNQGGRTSEETVEAVTKLARNMDKTPVWVKKDSPGFIVNRILVTYLNEASKLLEKYDKEQIDAAMQHKAGMPMGPFMLSDLIGIDIVYNILKVFEENFGPWYAPDKHIVDLYNNGKLGRKTGEGFYSYKERPSVTEEQAKGFDVLLLLEPFVKEAEKVVHEGIASNEDVDTAIRLGANIPKGPFEMKAAGLGEEKPVLTESKSGVLTITLNRPSKLNSMTLGMLEMIGEALDEMATKKSVKCIVFKGAGERAFCSGADFIDFPSLSVAQARDIPLTGHRVFRKLFDIPKPVVAVVHGLCLGGGNELVQFCDFVVASDKAKFGQTEVNLGLAPGWGGTYMLPKLVGLRAAKDLMMTGKVITAQEAKSLGLVSEVYPASEFEAKAEEYVKKLVDGPPIALASMKKLLNKDSMIDDALNAEEDAFTDLWNHDELKEGIAAFKEKRKPVYT